MLFPTQGSVPDAQSTVKSNYDSHSSRHHLHFTSSSLYPAKPAKSTMPPRDRHRRAARNTSQRSRFPAIFNNLETSTKLLEAILDLPGGRRSVSRLARTCKTVSELALNVLWRELDSLIPLLGLFPTHLHKKARKPGLGLVRAPDEDEWRRAIVYGERVRRLSYDESLNNVAASIFSLLEESQPRTFILPNLSHLNWKAETPAGLDRAAMFLSPGVESLSLEIGTRFPQLHTFLIDMASRTRLASFSFVSSTALPDAFTEFLLPQKHLQKIALVAPGALSPGVGKWIASLRNLRTLQLDLTGRSVIAVEGFFDDIKPQSGFSTPSSVGSTDSGVFSSEEIDFSEIRKSSLRLTGDLRSKAAFPELRQVHLTGDVSNIAVFLKHLKGELTHLDLVIEDPPDRADWQHLSTLISDRFGVSLKSLRISATGSARFADLVRSTARAEPASSRLSLKNLSYFPNLVRLDIDLPESIVFHSSDVAHAATAFPQIEILRLCPLARFPPGFGPPQISLADLAPLLGNCKRLNTLAVVINANGGSEDVLASTQYSSRSLLRLHVGHSWGSDPLQVSILLSHFAPFLENLKWFHEKGRPGVVEANAQFWQSVSELLPHLQKVRLVERRAFPDSLPSKPSTAEKSVDATTTTVTREVSIQASPSLVGRVVDATPRLCSVSVDATPSIAHAGVDATSLTVDRGIDARPTTASVGTDPGPPDDDMESVDSDATDDKPNYAHMPTRFPLFLMLPSIIGFFALARQLFIFSYPMHLFTLPPMRFYSKKEEVEALLSEKATNGLLGAVDDPEVVKEQLATSEVETDISPEHIYPVLICENEAKTPTATVEVGTLQPDSLDTDAASDEPARNPNPTLQLQIGNFESDASQTSSPSSPDTYAHPTMSEQRKQEKDFTSEVDAALPVATAIAQSGELQKALDQLFALEKQTRNAADMASTTRITKTITSLCYDAQDYDLLNSSILVLSKKHGQMKAVVKSLVEQAQGWLDEVKTRKGIPTWLQLVETLRTVTEGKLFLETLRARVTLLLSQYHESLAQSLTSPESAKDSMQLACDLLTDLQVETYSSMETKEKTEFILHQMRLLVAVARQKDAALKKDVKDPIGGGEAEWIKVRVAGRKVNEDFLKAPENETLKRQFYQLMIDHALTQGAYLDVAKYYNKIWETPSIKADADGEGKATLENIIYYIILAPHNNEQSNMLHVFYGRPALETLELQYNLVKSFVTPELMRWPSIETVYGPFLRKTAVFSADNRWEDLHTRVIEHNIRVVAAYYTRITMPRLIALLDLTAQQTEEVLARLVVSGTVWARIDRPAGIVNFRNKRSAEDVMNDWSSDMQKLLGLVEKTWMGVNAAQAAQSRVKS